MAIWRQKEKAAKKALPEDPLKVVPKVAPDVEVRAAEDGSFHLRHRIPPEGEFGKLVRRILPWKRDKLVNLDERGTAYWKLVNGKRTLEEIADSLTIKWKLDEVECRRAVVVYTRSLMIRNLIVLEVKKPRKGRKKT